MPSYPPGKHPHGFVKQHKHPLPLDDAPVYHASDQNKDRLQKRTRSRDRRRSFKKKLVTILFWAALIAVIYFFWSPIKFQLLRILQLNPSVWEFYLTLSHEIASQTLFGLLLTSFLGSLFFISIPVELVFLYYLSLKFSGVEVILFTVIGSVLGLAFDYFFGLLLGPKVLKKWFGKRYDSWQKKMMKYGGFILVIGNIIPFPTQLFSVLIGGLKYNFNKFVLFTTIGKLINFALLYFGYMYFSEQMTWFWNDTLWPAIESMYDAYILPLKGLF